MNLPFDPANSTAGNIPLESRITSSKELMHPYVHTSAIYNSQVLETAYVSIIDEWIKKTGTFGTQ